MQESKLCTGISILYEMEQNNYLMTRAIGEIDKKASQLGHSRPQQKPKFPDIETHFLEILTVMAGIGTLIGFIFGIIAVVKGDEGGIIYKFFFSILSSLIYAAIGVIIGFVMTVAICFVIYMIKHKKANEAYQEQFKSYNKRVVLDKERVLNELEQKSKLLKEREMLLLRLYEAKRHLDNFYDTMAIDYDFRGLIAVGYMNKFIKLGISTKLTGADGLYYLIMQELDKAIIKLSLIEISNKLDTVISNQNRLYDELYYINSKCDQMIESTIKEISRLDDIERNTELTNYCAGRIEKELEFQNFMLLYNSF